MYLDDLSRDRYRFIGRGLMLAASFSGYMSVQASNKNHNNAAMDGENQSIQVIDVSNKQQTYKEMWLESVEFAKEIRNGEYNQISASSFITPETGVADIDKYKSVMKNNYIASDIADERAGKVTANDENNIKKYSSIRFPYYGSLLISGLSSFDGDFSMSGSNEDGYVSCDIHSHSPVNTINQTAQQLKFYDEPKDSYKNVNVENYGDLDTGDLHRSTLNHEIAHCVFNGESKESLVKESLSDVYSALIDIQSGRENAALYQMDRRIVTEVNTREIFNVVSDGHYTAEELHYTLDNYTVENLQDKSAVEIAFITKNIISTVKDIKDAGNGFRDIDRQILYDQAKARLITKPELDTAKSENGTDELNIVDKQIKFIKEEILPEFERIGNDSEARRFFLKSKERELKTIDSGTTNMTSSISAEEASQVIYELTEFCSVEITSDDIDVVLTIDGNGLGDYNHDVPIPEDCGDTFDK